MSRRLKVLHITYSEMLGIFERPGIAGNIYAYPRVWCVPQGTRVLEVHEDPRNRCVRFTIEHESFPEVSNGDFIPDFERDYNEKAIRLYAAVRISGQHVDSVTGDAIDADDPDCPVFVVSEE